MEIREIKPIQVRSTNIIINEVRQIPNLPNWLTSEPPRAIPIYPPVTGGVGVPIIDMPGCVEAHQDNNREGKPWDKDLVEDDPDQTVTLCPDGSVPFFYPMNFEPDRVLDTIVAKRGQPPPPPPTPDTRKVVPPDEDVECPGPNSPRIGDVAQNKTEKVSGFELSKDGKICIVLYEDIGLSLIHI